MSATSAKSAYLPGIVMDWPSMAKRENPTPLTGQQLGIKRIGSLNYEQ